MFNELTFKIERITEEIPVEKEEQAVKVLKKCISNLKNLE
jgi:hypothetical protein